MRIAFYTLGCKVNQYETEHLKNRFSAVGFDVVEDTDEADVYVVNSCTVTSSGDKKTRQILHRLRRQNPNAVLALTGCMPQAFPEKAEFFPEVQVITGSYNRASLLEDVQRFLVTGERIVDITPHQKGEAFEPMKTDRFSEKTRAFVKIEDGCDRYCSYCIIPKARGPVRSKPFDELKEELTAIAQNGYQEVVLVGINLSSYGKEIGLRLVDAVELACSIPGICRVRLGSLEPELLSDEDIERMSKLPQLCPQFHLSLQSGCDQTLRRMNRHYDTAFYRELVEKLRHAFSDCAVTTDIMVGFPGETEEEFNQSLRFAEEIGFAQAHVFAYSVREGTRAAVMPNQIDRKTKEQRSHAMIETTLQTRRAYLESYLGKEMDVLFECTVTEDGTLGHTMNYIPVCVSSSDPLSRKIFRVKIVEVKEDYCIGELHS
jgi:threonylcarbamoyladenosine tRNA methylthiotransferase MtaB